MKNPVFRTIKGFWLLVLLSVFLLSFVLAASANSPGYVNRIGILKNIVLQPPVIELDVGNINWQTDKTIFLDRRNKKMPSDTFLRNFHGRHVEILELVVEGKENIAIRVRPIDF